MRCSLFRSNWIKLCYHFLRRFLPSWSRKQRQAWVQLYLERLESRLTPSTDIWTNTSGGNWATNSNWSTGAAPTAGQDVVIPTLNSGAYVRYSSGANTINSITEQTGASVILSGGTLTVLSTMTAPSGTTFTLEGGTLADATLVSGSVLRLSNQGGTLSGLTIAAGATVDGTQSLTTGYNDDVAYVLGGMTLNGTLDLGNSTATTYGQVYFQGTQTLSGQGTVDLGESINNAVFEDSNGSGTLTVGSGVTIQGGSGTVGAYQNGYTGASVALDGNVSIAAGGTLTINGSGWSNSGTITAASGATVKLGGSFTTAALGTFIAAGAMVDLTGTLNNTETTLALDADIGGNWYLDGGSILGGIVASADGSELVLTYQGGTLSGLTVAAGLTVDGTRSLTNGYNNDIAYVTGGLTLAGTLDLGNTAGTTYGQVYFQGTQTLSGPGTVVFGGSFNNALDEDSNGSGTLTVGSGMTIQGGSGTVGAYQNDYGGESVALDGNVSIGAGGTLTINGTGWSNNGTITVASGATVKLGGSFTTAALGAFSAAGATVDLTGTLNNAGTTLTFAAMGGDWNLAGGSIIGGTVASADGSELVLTNQGGTLSNLTIAAGLTVDGTRTWSSYPTNENYASVTGGLTLNGGLDLGNAAGTSYGQLTFQGAQALGGTGTLVLGDSTNNALLEKYSGTATLTVGSGVTIQGGSGTVGAYGTYGASETVALDGTINIATGGALKISGTNWSNTGTITAEGGATISLGGSFTQAALGSISAGSATVKLTGALNNADNTLTLAAAMGGNWYLDGGSIIGGTVASADGSELVLTNQGGTLSNLTIAAGVTVDGTRTWSSYPTNENYASVTGGLTLNGGLDLGNTAGTTYGQLTFQGAQTLDGIGTLVLGGSTNNALLEKDNGSATLTVGSGVTIQGGGGKVGAYGTYGGVEMVAIDGPFMVSNGGTLNLTGSLQVNGSAQVSVSGTSTLTIAGNLLGTVQNAALFNPQGTVMLNGSGTSASAQLLEAMSADQGAVAAGFTNNFAFGTLALSNNTYVTLVNQSVNAPGSSAEAVYANSLIVPAGSTLNLNGLNLYVYNAQIAGTITGGSIIQIPKVSSLVVNSPTSGNLSTAGELDDWTFVESAGHSLTVALDPGSGAAGGPTSPTLGWAQIQLLDPSGTVLATASSTTAGTLLTVTDPTLLTDGTYTISVRAASGRSSSTGNYVLTAYDVVPTVEAQSLNETEAGAITSPYAANQWTFSGTANTQIQFDLETESASGLNFSLTGPDGFSGFTNLTGSSGFITLPTSGTYTLTVQGTGEAVDSYEFETIQTESLGAQSGLTGNWQGTLTEPDYGGNPTLYNFSMDLVQTGNSVTGTEMIQEENAPQYFADINLDGSVSGTSFTFQESSITQQNIQPDFSWLIKSGTLQVSAANGSMAGPWSSEGFYTGDIEITSVSNPSVAPSDVTGQWQGTLYEPDYGGNPTLFDFSMDLVQTENSVTGTVLSQVQNEPQYYAEYSVTGSVSANTFTFQEGPITQQNPPPGLSWLIVSGTLQVSADDSSMGGTWDSDSYYGGTIDLTNSTPLPTPVAPAITSGDSATFTEGSSSSFTVTDTGTPTPTLSEDGPLPTGVTFDAATGQLSGTPTASGTYTDTFTASNSAGTVTQTFTLIVNPEAIDLSPLELQTAGGFTQDPVTNLFTATGSVLIGLEPAAGQPFQPFLQLVGTASYDSTTIQLQGTVSADIGSVTTELFVGTWTINVGQDSTNSIQLTAGSQSLDLGGLPVSVTSLALTSQGIVLEGCISLPTSASANAGPLTFAANGPLTMLVDGQNSILINATGISITGGQLQVPNTTLSYQNITFTTTDLTASYLAAPNPQQSDSFTIQGTATVSSPFGTLQANFSAPNAITITNGQASFVGTITLSNVPLPGGWALNNASINLDTVHQTLTASGSIHVPIGAGFDLTATLNFLQGYLNSVSVGATFQNGGQEIGSTPIYLQSINGSVENLANDGSQPITINGSLVLTTGPIITVPLPTWLGGPVSGNVMELDLNGTLTADEVIGNATLTVVGGLLAKGQGSIDFNETTGTLTETGSLTLLNGLVSANATFNVDGLGDITLSANASVTLPGFSLLGYSIPATQLTGGNVSLQYLPTSPLTSDFIMATGTDSLFGSGTYGLEVDFAGDVTQFDPVISNSDLQTILNSNSTPTFDVSNNTDLQTVISVINGLVAPATPATITVNMSGGPFTDIKINPPAGVTVVLTGEGSTTTVVGHSPALTVVSGAVIVDDMTFTTDTDSPSILVTGGNLILRDDTIEESTAGTDPAIALTGGNLDLGTTASPGGNVLNLNGTGEFVSNTTANVVPSVGDTCLSNGSPLTAIAQTGSGQSVAVGMPFSMALEVAVTDTNGNPMSGVSVTFQAPASGATGAFSGASFATAVTNANGLAIAPAFTAGTQPGNYTVTASVAGVSTSVSFTLTNTPALTVASTEQATVLQNAASGQVKLATFNESGGSATAADYTATVSWGDGGSSTSSGPNPAVTISISGTQVTVSGNHTYTAAGLVYPTVTLAYGSVSVSTSAKAIVVDVAADISSYTRSRTSPYYRNPLSKLTTSTLIVTNISKINLSGEFYLVLQGLTAGVTLQSARIALGGKTYTLTIDHTSAGDPMIIISPTLLARLASDHSFQVGLAFNNPSNMLIKYSTKIYSDPYDTLKALDDQPPIGK